MTLYTALLFVVLVPGLLFELPSKGSPLLVATIHGLLFACIYYYTHRLVSEISVSEGFATSTSYLGRVTEPTTLSLNSVKTTTTTTDIPIDTILPAGTTLHVGTQLLPGFVLPFDVSGTTLTLPTATTSVQFRSLSASKTKGTVLAAGDSITLAADVNLPLEITTKGGIILAKTRSNGATVRFLFPPGQTLTAGTVIPAGTTLGVGTRLPVAIVTSSSTNPANNPLALLTTISEDIKIPATSDDIITTAIMVMPLNTPLVISNGS